MHRVFNCGIGMVLVDAAQADAIAATLREQGETVNRIGEIVEQQDGMAQTFVVERDRPLNGGRKKPATAGFFILGGRRRATRL